MVKQFHERGFRKNISITVKQALEFNGYDILTENGSYRKIYANMIFCFQLVPNF